MTDANISLVGRDGRKYLTATERTRFLAAVRSHPNPSTQTLATTLAMTGARVSEILAVRHRDVDLEAKEIRISTLKRRREHWRAVPVPEDLVHALDLVHRVRRHQASPTGRERVLWDITRQTASRQVAGIMRAAGIEGPQASPRGLRHSFGVAAVTAGIPLPTLAAAMGHSNLASTAVYCAAIGEEARQLMSRLWN